MSDDVGCMPGQQCLIEGCTRPVTATIVGSLFCDEHEHFGDDPFDEQDFRAEVAE